MNNASLPLWASVTLHGREWIIHRASHRLPGRPQPCFVLQICSPTESALTGGFAAWEMFEQKPCVTERAPSDFGTGLPSRWGSPGSAWLVNKSASIKAKVIKNEQGRRSQTVFVSDASVMESDKNPFSPHMQIEGTCIVSLGATNGGKCSGESPRWFVDLDSCNLIYLKGEKRWCFSLNEEPESDLECLIKFALFGGWKVDTESYLEAWAISWFSWILEGDLSARPKDNKDPSPSFPIRDQATALKRWMKQVGAGLQKDFKDWPHSLCEPFCWSEEVKS